MKPFEYSEFNNLIFIKEKKKFLAIQCLNTGVSLYFLGIFEEIEKLPFCCNVVYVSLIVKYIREGLPVDRVGLVEIVKIFLVQNFFNPFGPHVLYTGHLL